MTACLRPRVGRLLILCLLIGRVAAAQSLGLTPAEIRATFEPQQVLQFDLTVSNEGDSAVPMRGSVTDLWFDAATNEKTFGAPGTSPRSAANWVTFVPAAFTVPPRGTATVKVFVTPPKEAAGGAYAVLFLESRPEPTRDPSSNRAVFANMRLGALLLLSARGTELYGAELTDATITPPAASQNLEVTCLLRNVGNTHIFPEARLTVMNDRRQVVARAESDIKRFFPGQQDQMKVAWSGSLAAGSYTALLTVSYGKDKVLTQALPFRVDARPRSGE